MPRRIPASRATRKKVATSKGPKRLSKTKKPGDVTLEEWQITLRKQIAQDASFRYKNVGDDPFFSEYSLTNPETNQIYRVAIRGFLSKIPSADHEVRCYEDALDFLSQVREKEDRCQSRRMFSPGCWTGDRTKCSWVERG